MIDSPGLMENNRTLSLALVSGQTKTPDQIENIVLKVRPQECPSASVMLPVFAPR